jgi:hypothetical protein
VRDAVVLGRRTGHYLAMTLILAVLLAGAVAGSILLGESWFQLLIAADLAMILTPFAFLAREAAHRSCSRLNGSKPFQSLGFSMHFSYLVSD